MENNCFILYCFSDSVFSLYLFIYLFILLFTPIWTQLAQLWMAQFRLMRPRRLIVLLDSTSRESITFSSNFQKTFPLKYSDRSSLIEIVWNTENEKCILGEFGQNLTTFFSFPEVAFYFFITLFCFAGPGLLLTQLFSTKLWRFNSWFCCWRMKLQLFISTQFFLIVNPFT